MWHVRLAAQGNFLSAHDFAPQTKTMCGMIQIAEDEYWGRLSRRQA